MRLQEKWANIADLFVQLDEYNVGITLAGVFVKILLVSFFFPPFNCIGAVRSGKTAKFLTSMGHDVRVLTAGNQPFSESLTIEVPASRVYSTFWFNINFWIEFLVGGRKKVAVDGYAVGLGSVGFLTKLGTLYKTCVNFPDAQIGWIPWALLQARRMKKDGWYPDVIIGSSSPPTSLIVASLCSKLWKVRWVAEYRDLWSQNSYYEYGMVRRYLEGKLENAVVGSAERFITISDPLADQLRGRFNRPVDVVLNGYDDDEYLNTSDLPTAILNYLSTNYPNIAIDEAELEDGIYEIELVNGLELEFDINGNFLSVEMDD